jgi:C-terminal processing protease CtpA/Prc
MAIFGKSMNHKVAVCLLSGISCLLLFTACNKNESSLPEFNGENPTQEWIYKTLLTHYFWYSQLPAVKSLDFTSEPESFFQSLLVDDDGHDGNHYSYLANKQSSVRRLSLSQTKYSYGFEFMIFVDAAKKYAAYIEYVVPNSPAARANLHRGDCIIEINGATLNDNNYGNLLGDGAVTLTVTTIGDASARNNVFVYGNKKTVALDAAEAVEDNPVLLHKVIEHGGKRVGYLLYNHFTAGITDKSEEYDEILRQVSNEFKAAAVNEVVLDLRYNNGGIITSAMLLCDVLAPANVFAEKALMGKLAYNDKSKPRESEFDFGMDDILKTGQNLDLSRLYVLTSNSTASASELVVNCLRPYYDVFLIGMQTAGKNVGSSTFDSPDEQWTMQPITCQVFNAKNESDYRNGFAPDVEISKKNMKNLVSSVSQFDLGDKNEILLRTALSLIDGTYIPGVKSLSSTSELTPVFQSIDRKATNGVKIRNVALSRKSGTYNS